MMDMGIKMGIKVCVNGNLERLQEVEKPGLYSVSNDRHLYEVVDAFRGAYDRKFLSFYDTVNIANNHGIFIGIKSNYTKDSAVYVS